MWQGIVLCAGLTLGGFALTQVPGIAESGISPLVFSLLLGLVAGNLPLARRLPQTRPGLQFATRWLLRGGIVLFGLSLTLQQILGLGPKVIVLDTLVITTVLVIGYWLGTRVLKLDAETALLTSAGSAICGAAAVLATETTIRSKPAATAMAVATVVLFGSLAMLLYPLLYPLTGMDEGLYGIYIGATIHEVAQVVAAGDAVGPQALANAVIVKLVRVMLLVPFLLPMIPAMEAIARDPEAQVDVPALALMGTVALSAWSIAVSVWIFRNAMDARNALALVCALGLAVAVYIVAGGVGMLLAPQD